MLEKIKKYYSQKKYQKAFILASRELKKYPNTIEYYYLLGLIHYSLDKFAKSINYLDLFLKYHPNQNDALIAKFHALRAMNKNHEAIIILERLLDLDARKSDIFLFLGECYLKISKIKEADAYLKKSLEIDNSKKNFLNIYKIYFDSNQKKKATQILRGSLYFKSDDEIKLKYCSDQINFNLGSFDEAFTILKSLLKNVENPKVFNLIGLCSLILGKINESKNYFVKSINYYSNNKGLQEFVSYVASSYYQLAKMNYEFKENQINEIKYLFSQNIDYTCKALLGFCLSDIYGIQKKFDESSKYLKKSNKIIFKNVIIPSGWKFEDEEILVQNLKKIYLDIKKKNLATKINVNPLFILGMPRSGTTLVENILSQSKDVHATGENSYLLNKIFNFFPKIKKEIISDHYSLSQFNFNYIENYLNFLKTEKSYFTDKTPLNFLIIGIIKLLIPNAKIIFCKRNLKDNLLSLFQTFFHSASYEYSYELSHLKKYYELHENIMSYWESENIPFFKLKYEDLIFNNEKIIRELCSYIGVVFSETMLSPHLNKRSVHTASSYQVREPINDKSINKWEMYNKFL